MRFPQLALSVRELDPESKTGVQVGLTFGPVEIQQFKMFYFRVLEARPKSPPDSLAEVRDKVREDYVRLHAYQRLVAEDDDIRQEIVTNAGFVELYDRFPNDMTVRQDMTVTNDQVTPPQGVTPLPAANTPELREGVAKLIEGWDPKQVATQIPLEQRVVVTPLPASLSVAFVIVTAHHPMTTGELRRNDFRVLRTAQTQWTDPDAANPFSFEALQKRLHYKAAKGQGDDKNKDEEPPDENDKKAPTAKS
jgi:hypothetical protein